MEQNNRVEFDGALLKIAKLYGYTLDKEQAELYFEVLKEFDIVSIKTALLQTARSVKFFPKPSEIIENIQGGAINKLDYDFEYIKSMVKELGFHNSVILPDKLLMVVIKDLGGLQEFAEMLSADEKDTYFRFKRIYQRRAVDMKTGNLPDIKRLVGYMETLSGQSEYGGTFKINYWDNKTVKQITSGESEVKQIEGNAPPVKDLIGQVMKAIEGDII